MIIKHEDIESEFIGGLLVERVLLSVLLSRRAATKRVCNMGVASASATSSYICDFLIFLVNSQLHESSMDDLICKIEIKKTLLQFSPLK